MTDYKQRAIEILTTQTKELFGYDHELSGRVLNGMDEALLLSVWQLAKDKPINKLEVLPRLNEFRPYQPLSLDGFNNKIISLKLSGQLLVNAVKSSKTWTTTIQLTPKSIDYIQKLIERIVYLQERKAQSDERFKKWEE